MRTPADRHNHNKIPECQTQKLGSPCLIPGCRLTFISESRNILTFGNHAFIRKENVTDPDLVRHLLSETEPVRNGIIIGGKVTGASIHAWLSRLTEYEPLQAASTGHSACIYGFLFRIMVPCSLRSGFYFPLAEKILALFGCAGFPHIIRSRIIGSGHFIFIFLSPREYFERGRCITVTASCTRYRNRKTGRICRADHPDAVLIHAKGDPIGKEFAYFGRKQKLFCQSRHEFARLIADAKQTILCFARLHGADSGKNFCLPRFDYADAADRRSAMTARQWNRAFQEAETYISCSRPIWPVSGFGISQTFIHAFQSFGRLFSPLFAGRAMHCRIAGRSFAFMIRNLPCQDDALAVQDLFLRCFRQTFNRFIALQTGGI